MPKRFKFLVCSLFHSCRSKDHLPCQPLAPLVVFPLAATRRQLARLRHLCSAAPDQRGGVSCQGETWAASGSDIPRRKKASSTSTSTLFRPRLSTSSTNNCLYSGSEEMEMDFSRSFYADSSTDFSPHLDTIREGPTQLASRHKKRANKAPKRSCILNKTDVGEDGEVGAPARLSAVFQRLMSCAAVEVEGKVRESFALVKRSDDPYEDFRRSMAEMIVEKKMVEKADHKDLLYCFLSLNSEHHHGIILTAFNDIWNAFFSNSNPTQFIYLPVAS